MIGSENAYVCEGGALDFIAETDLAAGAVVQFGGLIGVTRRAFKAGERATIALSGVFNLAITTAFAADLGADALYDFETKSLVATGGTKIGVFFDAVVSGDTCGTVKLS